MKISKEQTGLAIMTAGLAVVGSIVFVVVKQHPIVSIATLAGVVGVIVGYLKYTKKI